MTPRASQQLEQAVEALRREPDRPVRAQVDDLTVELRAVREQATTKTAADLFAEIGPWEGETLDEILAILADARAQGGSRAVSEF